MKRGITPIISIMVLLVVVVSISSLAYFYVGGFFTGVTEKTFDIRPDAAQCKNGVINVYVTNNGQNEIRGNDFSTHDIDDEPVNLQIGDGDQNPEYYFIATLDTNASVSIQSGLLQILPSP